MVHTREPLQSLFSMHVPPTSILFAELHPVASQAVTNIKPRTRCHDRDISDLQFVFVTRRSYHNEGGYRPHPQPPGHLSKPRADAARAKSSAISARIPLFAHLRLHFKCKRLLGFALHAQLARGADQAFTLQVQVAEMRICT
jgi:hypothetical protein